MFGLNQPANLRIMATTFKDGDPSFAGALGGIALGLASYHIFELKEVIPEHIWKQELAFKELEMEPQQIEQLCNLMRDIREG